MPSYVAGSVTAKIELDTTDFDKKIEGLKTKIDDLKVTLQKNGLADVSKQIKECQEVMKNQETTIKNLAERCADYKKQLKSLRNELKNGTTETKKHKNAVKELAKENEKYSEAVVKATKSEQLLRKNYDLIKRSTYLGKQIAEFEEIAAATDKATAATKRYYTAAGKELGQIIRTSKQLNETPLGNKVYHGGVPGAGIKASLGLTPEQLGFEIGKKLLQDFLKEFSKAPIQVKRSVEEIENAIRQFAQYDWSKGQKRALQDFLKEFSEASIKVKRSAAEIDQALSKFAQGLVPMGKTANSYMPWLQLEEGVQKVVGHFSLLKNELEPLPASFEKITNNVNLVSKAQEKFTQSLLSNADGVNIAKESLKQYEIQTKKTFETMQVELAKANAATYKYWKQIRGSADVKGYNNLGTLDIGINQYYGQIDKINAKLAEFKRTQQSINDVAKYTNEQFVGASKGLALLNAQLEKYTLLINQNTKHNQTLSNRINLVKNQISQLSNVSGKNAVMLTNQSRQAQSLSTRLKNLNNSLKTGKVSNEQYRQELNKLEVELKQLKTSLNSVKSTLDSSNGSYSKANAELKKLAEGYKQTQQAGKQSATTIKQTGNSMTQTAHSGRILSNTLYQIRGALLSLKMIATAMGGMALWGFAMEIAEGVKTTFAAKNEMEAQLKQNAKVGASGIETFNRALDNTVDRFKKINKYALGETVSSIGLEFELTSKQMEKAMPIVSMIQSEYVRAGRTSEEAALAVKDILQGEFQRLSRETGVGKEELIAYGWDEDKTNIDGLLKALEKAAKDRHWDVFAAKATSLNDVIQITKSRFEEFGADLLQSISPLIVGAFNTLADGLDGLKKAFDGLGSFGKNTVFAGLATGLAGLIGTGLPMVTKGMGLADIATIGWTKSLGTAIFNLNKATVAQYGFRKALAEVITGTKAEQLATVSSTKAIFGRILGINQSVMAQKGLLSALVAHKMELKGVEAGATRAAVANGKWYQKVEYLTAGFNKQGKVSDSLGRSLLRTATSWRVLRTAMLGVIGIAAIAWYSSMATWADTVRKNIQGLNEVMDNGKSMVKEATDTVNDYETALSKLTKGTVEYKKAANNLEVAKANEKDIKAANKLAQAYKKQNKETEKNIANRHKMQMARSYELAGIDRSKASEMASGWTRRVEAGEKNWIDSMNIYNDRLYKSNQHINEHIKLMNEANLSEEQKLKYIDEYSMKAEEVAENWKKFNQGDMTAGAYALLGELQLQWIDLWNNEHFINFWNSVKDTWEDLKPTIYAIKDALQGLGNTLLDFFSTKEGQIIGGIALTGTALFGLGTKIYHVLGGTKSTIDIIKTLGGKLKDLSGRWKDVGDKAEEAAEKMGGEKSTGGIKGETGKTTLGADIKNILGNRLKSFVNNALLIAEGMALMTEAIYLLQAPMWALAETGKTFKAKEQSIRAGIEGLQLIAPVVLAILAPIIALMKVMDMWGSQIMNVKTIAATAVGIALGLLFVTEAIIMLKAPLWALAQVGKDYAIGKNDIQGGITAMNTLGEALRALVPFVPIFIGGIALAAAAFLAPEIGLPAIGAAAAGIALGMLLVSEAVVTLRMPLEAIRELGNSFTDIEGVKKGADVIKRCAEALTYLEEAIRAMALVKWELLASSLADVIAAIAGHNLGDDLVKLTEEGGFLPKMNEFAKAFNQIEFTPVNPDKATALKTAADSLTSINDALSAAKTAIENLPDEFKNGGEQLNSVFTSYNQDTDKLSPSISGDSTTSYFDQLKQPIEDLKKFMDWFNQIEITAPNEDKVTALTSAATMVEQVNSAVEKVKTVMGNIAMGNVATNIAQTTGGGGWQMLAALNPFSSLAAGAGGGSGDYKSSIGSQLYEMEMVLTDLTTFNSKIAGLGGDGSTGGTGGNAQALAGMVTAVSNAINQLNSTLAQAVPNIKSNASNIGKSISDGIKTGMGNLTTLIVPPLVQALTSMKAYAGTYGKGAGYQLNQGFKSQAKLKSTVEAEVGYTMDYLDGKKDDFYNKGAELGDALARGFKSKGLGQESPGKMARTTLQEMYFMQDSLDAGIAMLPQKAVELGNALSSNFNPQLGLGGLSVDDLSAFQSGLDQVSYMATNTDMQTSTAFNNMNTTVATDMQGMTTSVNGSFTSINTNATSSYGRLVNTTRTSLKNMQSQTTKNIGAIRTSWKGMQTALIQSAETIRNQTSHKIKSLENNMASFWRKVQNPATLMGGAGPINTQHSIHRRSNPIRTPKGFAGPMKSGPKFSGISGKFKSEKSSLDPSMFVPLMRVFGSALKGHYAGGWSFDWTKDIQNSLLKWHTHFGEIYDDVLTVGKFENDDFPVRGIASIAKKYIYDAISRTHYVGYFDSRYGDDPVAAWNAGGFNCWDGTNIVLALANAFGFSGSRVHGTWDGIPHVWARIQGLGDIDATAIQGGYGFTASKVRGAGTLNSRNASSDNFGNTTNIGDVNVHVTIEGNVDNPEETGRRIADEAGRRIFDILKRSDATGL